MITNSLSALRLPVYATNFNAYSTSPTVTGMRRWYLGASFVATDWRVRVFGPPGLLDRLSDRMYVHNIPISGCM